MYKKIFMVLAILAMFSISETKAQEPYLAEVRLFAGNFAPRGWAMCEGQLLPLNQHMALFSLLGTTYGGDGRTTFALPDLRGRVPVGVGRAPDQDVVNLGENVTTSAYGDDGQPGLGLVYIICLEGRFPSRS